MSNQDSVASMPASESTSTAAIGDQLHAMMSGGVASSTVAPEKYVPEQKMSNSSDLDKLIDQQASDSNVSQEEADVKDQPQSSKPSNEVEHLELKVKGLKEPFKVPKNWEDPKVQELLNKGARFDARMQQLAKAQKDLEAKLAGVSDYESKAEVADRVEAARQLMEKGYGEHALAAVLGETAESFLDSLVEERIKYREASPEERLTLDLERQKKAEQLQRQRDADRIAKLEAQINARSEQVREAEFSGYIEDAKGRYDLGQWVEDDSMAASLNDMLHSAAMSDIIKLQRQREARGEENVTQRDIRRAYATRAKILIDGYRSQSSKLAEEQVAQQSEVATRTAQVASTKNYGQTDVMSQWQKSGGSMSDLVDMFRQKGGIF